MSDLSTWIDPDVIRCYSVDGKHRYGPEDVNRDMSAALAKMELGRWQGIVFHEIDLGGRLFTLASTARLNCDSADQALDGQVRPQGDETTRRLAEQEQWPKLDWDPLFCRLVEIVIAGSFLAILLVLIWPKK